MTTYFLIWLIQVCSFLNAAGNVLVCAGILAAVLLCSCYVSEESENVKNKLKKFTVIFATLGTLLALLPDQKTLTYITVIHLGKQGITSSAVKPRMDKIITILDKNLDKFLKEAIED